MFAATLNLLCVVKVSVYLHFEFGSSKHGKSVLAKTGWVCVAMTYESLFPVESFMKLVLNSPVVGSRCVLIVFTLPRKVTLNSALAEPEEVSKQRGSSEVKEAVCCF